MCEGQKDVQREPPHTGGGIEGLRKLRVATRYDRLAAANTRAEIDSDVATALRTLRSQRNTQPLFANAKSILIFPRILSGGFIIGGQYGQGALLSGDSTLGYYNIAGASFGFTIGAQVAGLAMFFMTDAARAALDAASGWEIGTGPTVVALDQGLQATALSPIF